MFDNVFVNPEAYRSFLATGTWPDKTVMVLEAREAKTKGSINQRGHFQGVGVMDLEVHVKDEARFPGKWAFSSRLAPGPTKPSWFWKPERQRPRARSTSAGTFKAWV